VDLDCDALVGCACGAHDCPVAHDQRVVSTPSAEPDADHATDDGPADPPRAPAPARLRLIGSLGAAACLACFLPMLGLGALSLSLGGLTIGWETLELAGIALAAIVVVGLLVSRRRTTGSCVCGQPPSQHG
jgi:hypothetical protein